MIQVGINENVILKSLSIADKGYLKIELSEVGSNSTVASDDPFAAASAGEAIDAASSYNVNILKLLVPKAVKTDGTPRTNEERRTYVLNDLNESMNKCKHILSCYTTSDKISALYTNVYAGTGFTPEVYKAQGIVAYEAVLLDQDNLDKVSANIFNALISGLAEFVGKDAFPMRIKLVRQSKEKHYGALPNAKYVSSEPFMEPMTIPVEASKVKFTAYEIKNGLNNGTPLTQASAEATTAPPAMAPGSDPFGQRQ